MQPRTLYPLVGFALLFALAPCALATVIDDEFNGTLNPAWQVVNGTRIAYPSSYGPANHYSMTDNPGYLRYYLDAMTHHDSFVYNQPGYYSCCLHDPGLDIRMKLPNSDKWTIDAAADIYLINTNGRYFSFTTYFGDGGLGTYAERFSVARDLGPDWVIGTLEEHTIAPPDYPWAAPIVNIETAYDLPDLARYEFRFSRDGGVLTAQYSVNGSDWILAFTQDMGTALNGLDQWVSISGVSWFVPAGSYADWDYVRYSDSVPEPSTLLMLLAGGVLVGAKRLLRRG